MINDLPDDVQNYVHRIGRRPPHKAACDSFATPDQRGEIRDIEQLIRAPLPISNHPMLFCRASSEKAMLVAGLYQNISSPGVTSPHSGAVTDKISFKNE